MSKRTSSGAATVNIRDVAAQAGVHPATVSRALNPETQRMVRSATLERVLQAASDLNYRANAIARSLRTQHTATLGVVIPDITNPMFARIVRGIDDALRVANHTSLVVYTGEHDDQLLDRVGLLRERGVDGLIVATARRRDASLETVLAEPIPLVQVNRRSDNEGIASVTIDDAAATAGVVEHLVELGHERMAHLGAPSSYSTGHARMAGFRAAMRNAGLPVRRGFARTTRALTIAEGERVASMLLGQHPDVTAIIAANDLLALGCYDALAKVGLRCPEDISIVGFNDMPFADRFNPPLTTVHFDHYEMGKAAGQVVLRQLLTSGSAAAAEHVELPTRLIVRGSTAPPR